MDGYFKIFSVIKLFILLYVFMTKMKLVKFLTNLKKQKQPRNVSC
jgi:hypothetical protein